MHPTHIHIHTSHHPLAPFSLHFFHIPISHSHPTTSLFPLYSSFSLHVLSLPSSLSPTPLLSFLSVFQRLSFPVIHILPCYRMTGYRLGAVWLNRHFASNYTVQCKYYKHIFLESGIVLFLLPSFHPNALLLPPLTPHPNQMLSTV